MVATISTALPVGRFIVCDVIQINRTKMLRDFLLAICCLKKSHFSTKLFIEILSPYLRVI